jgi:Uma2 family endonuclease
MLMPVRKDVTLAEVYAMPDDGMRREVIDGDLFVSPRPARRHQQVMAWLITRLTLNCEEFGGEALTEPNNDYGDRHHIEPDIVLVRPENAHRLTRLGVDGPPDLVVEISSPSTWAYDVVRKRAFYEREGVPEYWFIDLNDNVVMIHSLHKGGYQMPVVLGRGDKLISSLLPGLELDVERLLKD